MSNGTGASNSQEHVPPEAEVQQKQVSPPPCGRCGKPTREERGRFSSDGTILCFWCAYVETQG